MTRRIEALSAFGDVDEVGAELRRVGEPDMEDMLATL